jgi:predicted HicB family RNase H-like nuclease
MLEYEAVLTRREQLERTGLTVEETNAILDALAAVSEAVTFRFLWRRRLKDPRDETLLDTAVNGQEHRLATFNVRHLAEAAREFGIRAISRRVRSDGSCKERSMRSNVALRLQTSLLEEARRVAQSEGVALNQLINVAVAEKLSALRTDDYFRERSSRANIGKAKRILKRAGRGRPPAAGDEF